MTGEEYNKIVSKVKLGLQLTKQEQAKYNLFILNESYDPCDHCTRPWCHGCKYQEK